MPLHHKQDQTFTLSVDNPSIYNLICCKPCPQNHRKFKRKLLLEFSIGLHYRNINQKVLLKVDTGSNINCISLGSFQRLFPNRQLSRATLLLENYRNTPVSIIGRFTAFIRWNRKVFHQEIHVTNANSSPNLLSRGAGFRMEVLQTCFMFTGTELPQPEPVIIKTTSVSKIEEMSQSKITMWENGRRYVFYWSRKCEKVTPY